MNSSSSEKEKQAAEQIKTEKVYLDKLITEQQQQVE
jgi:hypothetical protein